VAGVVFQVFRELLEELEENSFSTNFKQTSAILRFLAFVSPSKLSYYDVNDVNALIFNLLRHGKI